MCLVGEKEPSVWVLLASRVRRSYILSLLWEAAFPNPGHKSHVIIRVASHKEDCLDISLLPAALKLSAAKRLLKCL
jgi:hypothetical protein